MKSFKPPELANVMFPTVVEVPLTENASKTTPLTVALEPGPKFAEAKSVPVVSTSTAPEMVVGEPQLMTAAFAGSMADESARAVTVTAAKMLKDLLIIKNFLLRGKQTRPEEERNDL
ncbi:MAG: hypothetical protein WCO76_07760 [Planctomycetota bacterium]